jgi:chaperonin GroES
MSTQIQPLRDNVLVKIIRKEAKTKSGLVLPDSANAEKPQEGKVIAIGKSADISVKPGQTVIFAKYSGTELKLSAEDYLLIKNEDLLAIIK